ncbi:MAG: SRPBCC family protein [Zymomonas sp.]|nr:MAG: SRPBCC family protein [Zymomonas sp.]
MRRPVASVRHVVLQGLLQLQVIIAQRAVGIGDRHLLEIVAPEQLGPEIRDEPSGRFERRVAQAAAQTLAAASAAPSATEGAQVVTTATLILASADVVWDAIRDVYNVDTRLVPGMVAKVERQDDMRKVTFANGYVVTERIISLDDRARRITYSAFGGRTTHHLVTMQVIADGSARSRVVWRTEFMPAELRPLIEQNMKQGSAIMKQHLEAGSGG